jgi:hypothetical protein
VNKWDSFDPDEEIKKIDGEEQDDDGGSGGGGSRAPSSSASKKQQQSSQAVSLDGLTRQAREVEQVAKSLLDKRLDGITHDMANSPDLFADSAKLRKKRQRLSKKLNDALVPQAQQLVAAVLEARKRHQQRQQQEQQAHGSSNSGASSPGSPGSVGGTATPRPVRSAADIAPENGTGGGNGGGAGAGNQAARSVAGSAWNKDNRQ